MVGRRDVVLGGAAVAVWTRSVLAAVMPVATPCHCPPALETARPAEDDDVRHLLLSSNRVHRFGTGLEVQRPLNIRILNN